jgi:hypothetical protein
MSGSGRGRGAERRRPEVGDDPGSTRRGGTTGATSSARRAPSGTPPRGRRASTAAAVSSKPSKKGSRKGKRKKTHEDSDYDTVLDPENQSVAASIKSLSSESGTDGKRRKTVTARKRRKRPKLLTGRDRTKAMSNVEDLPVYLRIIACPSQRVNAAPTFSDDNLVYIGYPKAEDDASVDKSAEMGGSKGADDSTEGSDSTGDEEEEGNDEEGGDEEGNDEEGDDDAGVEDGAGGDEGPGDREVEEESPTLVEVGVSCPLSAKVPVVADGAGNKSILKGGCEDAMFIQAIKRLLPDGLKLNNKASIRVPLLQWSADSQLKYCDPDRESTPKDFITIKSTMTFTEAVANRALVSTMESSVRKNLEDSALDLSGEDDDELLTGVQPYLILELLVGVKFVKQKSPYSIHLLVEIGAPVKKITDGEYEVEDVKCISNQSEPIRVILGNETNEERRCTLGMLRCKVKDVCHLRMAKYKSNVHAQSLLYWVPHRSRKQCERISSTKALYEIVKRCTTVSTSKEHKIVEKSIRLALTCVEEDSPNQPRWTPTFGRLNRLPRNHPVRSSVPPTWHSPAVKAAPPNRREQRAAGRQNDAPDILVAELYNNIASPVYHGLTKEMCAVLKKAVLDPEKKAKFELQEEEVDRYPLNELIEYFQEEPIAKIVNHLVPQREAYMPVGTKSDGSGIPPSHPPPTQADMVAQQLSAITEMASAVKEVIRGLRMIRVMRYVFAGA